MTKLKNLASVVGLLAVVVAGSAADNSIPETDSRGIPTSFRVAENLIGLANDRFMICENRGPATPQEFLESPYLTVPLEGFTNPYTGEPIKLSDTPSPGDLTFKQDGSVSVLHIWVRKPGGSVEPVFLTLNEKQTRAYIRLHWEGLREHFGPPEAIQYKPCYEASVPYEQRVAVEVGYTLTGAIYRFSDKRGRIPNSPEELYEFEPPLRFLKNAYQRRAARPVTQPSPGDFSFERDDSGEKPRIKIIVYGAEGIVSPDPRGRASVDRL
jgi:hypothetical protein